MEFFSELHLLADAAQIVTIQPSLLDSLPEVEFQRSNARLGVKIMGKRSVRAKKVVENALKISLPSGASKKRKRKTGLKKQGIACRSATRKELPLEAYSKIQELCGTNLKLILEKVLTPSDLNTNLGRFSFPPTKVLADFLEQDEHQSLESGGTITVPVIEPSLGVSILTLRRWKMSTRPVYVITTGWNEVVHNPNNGLKEDDLVHIWSFRAEGRLGLAIMKADVGEEANESSPHSPTSVLLTTGL